MKRILDGTPERSRRADRGRASPSRPAFPAQRAHPAPHRPERRVLTSAAGETRVATKRDEGPARATIAKLRADTRQTRTGNSPSSAPSPRHSSACPSAPPLESQNLRRRPVGSGSASRSPGQARRAAITTRQEDCRNAIPSLDVSARSRSRDTQFSVTGGNPTAPPSPHSLGRFVGSEASGLDSCADDFAGSGFLLGVTDAEGVFPEDKS